MANWLAWLVESGLISWVMFLVAVGFIVLVFATSRQALAVTRLNIASLPQRLAMSLASVGAVAMAVAVLLGFLALSNGFRATYEGSGSRNVAIVVRSNSEAELSSILSPDQVRLLETAPGMARRADKPLSSAELYVIVDGRKKSTGTNSNLPLRGVSTEGLHTRENVRMVRGRMFAPGSNEIVVGASLLREFSGFEFDRDVRLGQNVWKVVGVFEAPGSVFESELWADARVVQALFNRGNSYQTFRAVMAGPRSFAQFKRFVEQDPRLQLKAVVERDFYAEQAQGTFDLIRYVGWPLGIIMAIGALAGALNTMYSSVSARAAEIATLRIIGFSGYAAFFGTMVEALALAVIGALAGAAFCFVFFNGMTTSTLGQNFSQVVFQLKMSHEIISQALIMAIVIGFVGGILPGIRAARQSPHLELAGQ